MKSMAIAEFHSVEAGDPVVTGVNPAQQVGQISCSPNPSANLVGVGREG